MPREVNIKYALAKAIIKVDKMVFREFAELTSYLGFESPEITKLRKHLYLTAATQFRLSKYLLIKNGLGKPKKQRCELLSRKTYKKDCVFLNLCNIPKKEEIGEGITSFFVWKSVYFAFFGKSALYMTQEKDEIDYNEIDYDKIDYDEINYDEMGIDIEAE